METKGEEGSKAERSKPEKADDEPKAALPTPAPPQPKTSESLNLKGKNLFTWPRLRVENLKSQGSASHEFEVQV